MTVYFPLVVHGAMLIEPTESESKASLDLFIMTLRDLAMSARRGEKERFVSAPLLAPRRRLDETRAARQPVLRWTNLRPPSFAAEFGRMRATPTWRRRLQTSYYGLPGRRIWRPDVETRWNEGEFDERAACALAAAALLAASVA